MEVIVPEEMKDWLDYLRVLQHRSVSAIIRDVFADVVGTTDIGRLKPIPPRELRPYTDVPIPFEWVELISRLLATGDEQAIKLSLDAVESYIRNAHHINEGKTHKDHTRSRTRANKTGRPGPPHGTPGAQAS